MNAKLYALAKRTQKIVLGRLKAMGAFNFIANSEWRRHRLTILCYHGVSLEDEHLWDPELFVSPAFLRRRFEILRDGGYTVLTLGNAACHLRSETLPKRSVVITFDDGFHNFFAAAVPLLQEFGYPATNYVSTYFCVNQFPLAHLAVRYLLWR